jgi:CTP:molybdopterin cytidylyltransferase MocA
VAAIVLAAGGSRRLGRAKQLLAWRGVPLVRRAAQAALASGADAVVAVVGAEETAVRGALAGLGVEVCRNAGWESGIGSSIAAGVRHALTREPPAEAVLLLLADQPHVDAELLARVVEAARCGHRRVACAYGGTRGSPACFSDPDDLVRLSALARDEGARALLAGRGVHTIAFEAAAVDIDTDADWERFLRDSDGCSARGA